MEFNRNVLLFVFILIVIILILVLFYIHAESPKSLSDTALDDFGEDIITIYDFSSVLTGMKESPPVKTDAFGTGRFTLAQESKIFTYEVNFTGISRLNQVVIEQNNGTIVKILNMEVTLGELSTVSGVWTGNDDENPLTDTLIQQLIDNKLHLNIKTKSHLRGEIRGLIENEGVV